MSRGHKYTLVCASLAKRALQGEMRPEMRLEFLSHLDKMVDTHLTPAVIAMVEPMCSRGLELSMEASKLGRFKALDVYADKFDALVRLNPSLQMALEEAWRPWKKAAS